MSGNGEPTNEKNAKISKILLSNVDFVPLQPTKSSNENPVRLEDDTEDEIVIIGEVKTQSQTQPCLPSGRL